MNCNAIWKQRFYLISCLYFIFKVNFCVTIYIIWCLHQKFRVYQSKDHKKICMSWIFRGNSCRFGRKNKNLDGATQNNCCQLHRVKFEPTGVGRLDSNMSCWRGATKLQKVISAVIQPSNSSGLELNSVKLATIVLPGPN